MQNLSNITVKVQGPQKKGNHRVYSLIGSDKNGDFNIVKRFSDFQQLRKIILNKWPGCYIPSLPQRKLIGGQDPILLQIRKKGISNFIYSLKSIEFIWYAQECQIFLHRIGQTDKELQKIKQASILQILQKYEKVFPHLKNKQVSDECRDELIKFGQQLKKMKQPLQNLDKKVNESYSTQKKFKEKFITLIDTLLPDYERNCLQVYKNGSGFHEMVFTGSKKEKIVYFYDKFTHDESSMLQVVYEIKRQKEEIQSFQALLKVKQQYSNQRQKIISKIKDLQTQTTKIHGGKESLLSKIKNKTKDQQLKDNQQQIKKTQEEQKKLGQLCNFISLILAQNSIERFKNQRVRAYYGLLRRFFEVEKVSCQLRKQFWVLIQKENTLEKQEMDNFFDSSPQKVTQNESPQKNFSVQQQQSPEKQLQDKKTSQLDQQKQKQTSTQNQQTNENELKNHEIEQISNDQNDEQPQKQDTDHKQITEE